MQMKPLLDAGYRVIVPDLRGFGDSDAPAETSAYAMKELADDMVALLDQLKIDKYAPQRSNSVLDYAVRDSSSTVRLATLAFLAHRVAYLSTRVAVCLLG